jgi:UDP-N-acetyl-D-glucosamine dehydrogenase
MATEFIELAGKVNQQMPYHCVERIDRALNEVGKPVNGSRIAILGVSYKSGVGDIRESPAMRIIQVLAERGGTVVYHDDYVPALPDLGLESGPLDRVTAGADAVVLTTVHPGIDYAAVAAAAEVFVDLRGVTHGLQASGPEAEDSPAPSLARDAEPVPTASA